MNNVRKELLELYKDIKDITKDIAYLWWYTSNDIDRAIEDMDNFSDEELEAEYNNMKTLRDFHLKRMIIEEGIVKFGFTILKIKGIPRTKVIMSRLGNDNSKELEIKLPANLNRIEISRKFVDECIGRRIRLYVKSLDQFSQDYTVIDYVVRYRNIIIIENGREVGYKELAQRFGGYIV